MVVSKASHDAAIIFHGYKMLKNGQLGSVNDCMKSSSFVESVGHVYKPFSGARVKWHEIVTILIIVGSDS